MHAGSTNHQNVCTKGFDVGTHTYITVDGEQSADLVGENGKFCLFNYVVPAIQCHLDEVF